MCKFAWCPYDYYIIFAPCKAQTVRRLIMGMANLRKASVSVQENIDIFVIDKMQRRSHLFAPFP